MAEQPCLPQVQACAIRVAVLDASGDPLAGLENLYVSDALVELTVTHVYTDGDEIEEKTACGNVGVNYRADDTFKRIDVTVKLVTPDPFLTSMLSGGAVLQDGDRRGAAAAALGPVTGNGVSIELWSKRIDNGSLDADSPYAWWAYPRIKNLRHGDHSHANSALLPSFSGQGYENDLWLDGPLNDWPAASDRVWQWIPTDTLPTPSCGFQELVAS